MEQGIYGRELGKFGGERLILCVLAKFYRHLSLILSSVSGLGLHILKLNI